MKTTNLVSVLFTACFALYVKAQITPSTIMLSSINYDAPITHTKEVWSTMGYTLYNIDITRDANNYITNITTSTPPPLTQDQSKTTGTRAGNVYTAITQKNHNGGAFENAKRETWESDGTHDTCIWMEVWNTTTSSWDKSQRNVFTYSGSNLESITTYFWNTTSGWNLSTKNVWTFVGGKMDRNDGSAWNSTTSAWEPNGYFKYFYTGNKMDSMQQWSKDMTTSAIYLQYRFAITPDANNKTSSFTQMKWKGSAGIWENSLTISYSNGSTGVGELNAFESASVYPVPANNLLNIALSCAPTGFLVAKVMALDGREISRQPLDENNSTLNTSDLADGIYFLLIESENKPIYQQKLTIAHH